MAQLVARHEAKVREQLVGFVIFQKKMLHRRAERHGYGAEEKA